MSICYNSFSHDAQFFSVKYEAQNWVRSVNRRVDIEFCRTVSTAHVSHADFSPGASASPDGARARINDEDSIAQRERIPGISLHSTIRRYLLPPSQARRRLVTRDRRDLVAGNKIVKCKLPGDTIRCDAPGVIGPRNSQSSWEPIHGDACSRSALVAANSRGGINFWFIAAFRLVHCAPWETRGARFLARRKIPRHASSYAKRAEIVYSR